MTEVDEMSATGFNNPIILPSLDEIDRMDKLRQEAIASLEVLNNKVKCQKCGVWVPIAREPLRSSSNTHEISNLRTRIRSAEQYSRRLSSTTELDITIQKLKEKLAALMKEEEKQDLLRRLPLYSSLITRYKWLCSGCYELAYRRKNRKRKYI
jgi:hypothetical protein